MLSIGTVILGVAAVVLTQHIPKKFFEPFGPFEISLMAAGLVAVLDALLLSLALARFKRSILLLG